MTQLTENVFAVEVPEGARNIKLFRNRIYYQDVGGDSIDLSSGTWQIICTTKECTEEQAKGIVGSSEWYFPARHTRYIDYAHPYNSKNKQEWSVGFSGPRDSLNSLLTSKGLDGNKNYVLLKKEVIC